MKKIREAQTLEEQKKEVLEKMKKSKICLTFLLCLVITLLLSQFAAAKEEIVMYWNPNHNYDAYIPVIEEFQEEYDVEVVKNLMAWPDFRTKIRADFAAGTVPDLIETPAPWVSEFGSQGQLLDITEWIEEYSQSDDWYDITWVETSVDGRIFGMKIHHTAFGLYWNKGLFVKAGLDPNKPPTNLAEFKELARLITEKLGPEVHGFGFDADSQYLMPFLASRETPRLLNEDNEIAINTPTIEKTLQILQDIAANGWALTPEPGASYQAMRRTFMAGKTAMMVSGPWDIKNLAQVAPDMDYGVTMVPHLEGVKPLSLTAGTAISIPAKSGHPELAFELAKRLTAVKTLVEVTKEAGMLNARKSWAADPVVQSMPRVADFTKVLPYGVPFDLPARKLGVPEIAWGGMVFNDLYQNIVYNRVPAKEALELYIKDAKRAIERAAR